MTASVKIYDSVTAAKYLMAKAAAQKRQLNVTKVQKLLYIAYGLMLADTSRKMVSEQPQAWPFGPVFPRTRRHVDYSKIYDINDEEFAEISKDETVNEYIDASIKYFSEFSAARLSDWSHDTNSPWDKTKKQDGFTWGMPISDDLIKEYFKKFIS